MPGTVQAHEGARSSHHASASCNPSPHLPVLILAPQVWRCLVGAFLGLQSMGRKTTSKMKKRHEHEKQQAAAERRLGLPQGRRMPFC
jgi:hypothetical protein